MLNKIAILLLLTIQIFACSSGVKLSNEDAVLPKQDKPSEQNNSAKVLVEEAIKTIRSQKGYKIKFNTRTDIPKSDSLKMEGEVTVLNPDTLYVRFEGSGGQKRKVVRKGAKILMEHPLLGEWLDPADMGEGGVGNGFQNPENVLNIVDKHLENTKLNGEDKANGKSCNIVDLNFDGAGVKEVLAEQAIDVDSVKWEESELSAKLWIGKNDRLLYKLTIESTLISTKEGIVGEEIKYRAQAEVVSYNDALELKEVPQNVRKLLGIR